jgi:hypothetical protein
MTSITEGRGNEKRALQSLIRCVRTEKPWYSDLLLLAVQAHGLTDGEHMSFVESVLEGRAAMP